MSVPGPPSTPTYSPDGKWWWSGTQWLPTPPQAQGAPQGRPGRTTTPAWGQKSVSTGFVIVILAVLGVVAFSVISEASRSQEFGNQQRDAYCADRGYTSTECR